MPDAYVKQTWIDGVAGATPISAARLAHIEDGIENATVEDGTYGTTPDGNPATALVTSGVSQAKSGTMDFGGLVRIGSGSPWVDPTSSSWGATASAWDTPLGSVPDSTEAVNNALASLRGGEARLPPGLIRANIVVPTGVTLKGVGRRRWVANENYGTGILGADASLPIVDVAGTAGVSAEQREKCVVTDLDILGESGNALGLRLQNARLPTVRNVGIHAARAGIQLSRSSILGADELYNVDLTDVSITNCYDPLFTGGPLVRLASGGGSVPVTTKALTSNAATLTTYVAHGLTAGASIVVSGVGSPFDGTVTIDTTPTSTTFTYAVVAGDVASVATDRTNKAFVTIYNLEIRSSLGKVAMYGCFSGAMLGGFIGSCPGLGLDLDGASAFTVSGLNMENMAGGDVVVRGGARSVNLDTISTNNSVGEASNRGRSIYYQDCVGGSVKGCRIQASASEITAGVLAGIELAASPAVQSVEIGANSYSGFTGALAVRKVVQASPAVNQVVEETFVRSTPKFLGDGTTAGQTQWRRDAGTGVVETVARSQWSDDRIDFGNGSSTRDVTFLRGGGNIAQITASTATRVTGDMEVTTVGKTLKIKEGTNAKMGTAVLVGGTVTVPTTAVTANSRIILTSQLDGGTVGFLRVSARTAGTSFVITSSSGADTSTVAWVILEPA